MPGGRRGVREHRGQEGDVGGRGRKGWRSVSLKSDKEVKTSRIYIFLFPHSLYLDITFYLVIYPLTQLSSGLCYLPSGLVQLSELFSHLASSCRGRGWPCSLLTAQILRRAQRSWLLLFGVELKSLVCAASWISDLTPFASVPPPFARLHCDS